MPSFNLVEEPFIPCLRTGGEVAQYGLREILARAHEIVELRDDSPLVSVALHRLLLAILHRCYQGPKSLSDRLAIHSQGRFDTPKVAEYFEKWKDRFDLFSQKHPFYQRSNFEIEDAGGSNRLAQELACNNNPTLFDHTVNAAPPALDPAAAARAVICTQAYAVGGGVSKQGNSSTPIPNLTNAPLVGGAAVLVRGRTLFETLWLNLTIYDGSERPIPSDGDDAPSWERGGSEPHLDPEEPRGYLDYLTWQSRTLHLHPEGEEGRQRVTRVSFAQGRRLRPRSTLFDPMFAYHRGNETEPFYPVRFNEFRDLWRESAALYQLATSDDDVARAPNVVQTLGSSGLRDHIPRSARYAVSVSGLCINSKQAADVLFWRHETLPLPLTYLDNPALVEQLKRAIGLAEKVASEALRRAAWVTAAACLTGDSGMAPDKKRVQNLLDSFAPELRYWSRLELPYRELLVALATPGAALAKLIAGWFFDTLCETAWAAFDSSIGRIEGGRNYKASAAGESALRRLLKKVQLGEQIPDRETKEGAA